MSNNCIKRLLARIFYWSYLFAVKGRSFKDSLITADPRKFEEFLMNAARDFGETKSGKSDWIKERVLSFFKGDLLVDLN